MDAVGGSTAKPPSCQSNPTFPRLAVSGDHVVGDVVDFELAGVDVVQHEIGRTRSVNRGDAREPPIQTDRADEGGAGDLIVLEVVDLQPAGRTPLKLPTPENCQSSPTVPMKAAPRLELDVRRSRADRQVSGRHSFPLK